MKYLFILLLVISTSALAEYSQWATPNHVSLVTSAGFRVEGEFGKFSSCELENIVFVNADHPQYNEIYSTVLAAFASKSRIRFEFRKCGNIGWISSKSISVLDSSSTGEVGIRP